MRLKAGQYVRHSKFGWGTILEDDGKQTMVFFRRVGIRKFAGSAEVFALIVGAGVEKNGGHPKAAPIYRARKGPAKFERRRATEEAR